MKKISAEGRTMLLSSTKTLAGIAVLSALSYGLSFLEFPVPLTPSFALMDFSDFPALIGAFVFGPISGVIIEVIKNALGLLTTATAGIGELANFIMGASFVFTAGLFYKIKPTIKSAIIGCAAACIVMGVTAALTNYYLLLPLFEQFMPIDAIIAEFSNLMPFIKTKADVVIYNCFPFNLLKGVVISVVTLLIFRKLTPIFRGKGYMKNSQKDDKNTEEAKA